MCVREGSHYFIKVPVFKQKHVHISIGSHNHISVVQVLEILFPILHEGKT